MLAITHALTGGFIATKVENPALSLPLILLVHYAMDLVPHWDLGTGLKKRGRARTAFWGTVELLVAFLATWFLFQKNHPISLILWLGILVSLTPDFLDAPLLFLGLNLPFSEKLYRFHHRFHRKHVLPLGLLPQIIIIIAILLLL